jgi:hypothetical protein
LRLGVRQGLDCRPQLIDTGQSVPQRQQALGAERGRAQLLIRCDQRLAVANFLSLFAVRGVFSGTLKKKLGLTLASAKEERGRVYRIAAPANL